MREAFLAGPRPRVDQPDHKFHEPAQAEPNPEESEADRSHPPANATDQRASKKPHINVRTNWLCSRHFLFLSNVVFEYVSHANTFQITTCGVRWLRALKPFQELCTDASSFRYLRSREHSYVFEQSEQESGCSQLCHVFKA